MRSLSSINCRHTSQNEAGTIRGITLHAAGNWLLLYFITTHFARSGCCSRPTRIKIKLAPELYCRLVVPPLTAVPRTCVVKCVQMNSVRYKNSEPCFVNHLVLLICRTAKSRTLWWTGHVTRIGEERGAYEIFVCKPVGKRPLWRLRNRWRKWTEGRHCDVRN